MQQAGRYRGTGKPNVARALRAREFGRDPISAEGIMASGTYAPHQQVEHMAAPTSIAKKFIPPLPKERRPHMCRFSDAFRDHLRARGGVYGV